MTFEDVFLFDIEGVSISVIGNSALSYRIRHCILNYVIMLLTGQNIIWTEAPGYFSQCNDFFQGFQCLKFHHF